MSQCLFSSVNLMMVLNMWLTHHDHQLNAVHDF